MQTPSLIHTPRPSPSGSDNEYDMDTYRQSFRLEKEKEKVVFTTHTRVVADNVIVGFESRGREKKGVIVERSFEVREELV
jgi:hypothetical protein